MRVVPVLSIITWAPFIGALLAIAMGDRSLSVGLASGGALMLAGVGVIGVMARRKRAIRS